jgi:hypothetical protein
MTRSLRGITLAAAFLLSASSLSAQLIAHASDGTTVSDMVSRLRNFREAKRAAKVNGSVKPNVVSVDWAKESFIIPAAGSLQGSNGTFFKSDVTIANRRGSPQVIEIGFISRGVNNGTKPTKKFTIGANTTTIDNDFIGIVMGESGLGTLLVVAVTGTQAGAPVDELAEIDGFSRIWTPQPIQPGASSSIGTVSQAFESIDLEDNLATSYGYGLKQDANFRTNVGMVNLYGTSNTFTVNIVGTLGNTQFQQTVQPYSMEQPAVPAGNWGDFYIRISTSSSNFNWWSAYGTTVDNRTGDGWVSHVH